MNITLIRRYLLNSGLDENSYNLIKPLINKRNRDKLVLFSALGSAVLLAMFVISFFSSALEAGRFTYLVGAAVCAALLVFSCMIKSDSRWITAGVYAFIMLMLSVAMILSVVNTPDEKTVLFIVVMLITPIVFNDRPIRMIGCIAIFTAAFIAAALAAKTGYVLEADIINVVMFAILSAVAGTYMSVLKCRNHSVEREADSLSKTDVLTGLGNRYAYMSMNEKFADDIPEDLTLIFFDVTGLKRTNDSYGHDAGDELLRGAADCIVSTFGKYGICCRTGGDEFIACANISRDELPAVCREFDMAVGAWKGKGGGDLLISYGCAAAYEFPNTDFAGLSKQADIRLYKHKESYYMTRGVDRRGQNDMFAALSASFEKILIVDLAQDTYKIVKMNQAERAITDGLADTFTEWVGNFVKAGMIHEDDVAEFVRHIDIDNLRAHFLKGGHSYGFRYRKKGEDGYLRFIVELVPSTKYSEDNQQVYLFTKYVGKA